MSVPREIHASSNAIGGKLAKTPCAMHYSNTLSPTGLDTAEKQAIEHQKMRYHSERWIGFKMATWQVVRAVGLEPTRGYAPTDFKSGMSTIPSRPHQMHIIR